MHGATLLERCEGPRGSQQAPEGRPPAGSAVVAQVGPWLGPGSRRRCFYPRARTTRKSAPDDPRGIRHLRLSLPEDVRPTVLTFSTYDAAGRLLASWRRAWEYWHVTGGPDRIGFRPEAVRLVVTSAEGARAESALDRDELALTLR